MFSFLTLPILPDSESTRKAEIAFKIVSGSMIIVSSLLFMQCFTLSQYYLRWIITLVVFDLSGALFLFLNRKGHTRIASVMFVAFLIVIILGLAWSAGGIRSAAMQTVPIVVLVAGLILGWREGILVGIVTIVGGLCLVVAEQWAVLPPNTVIQTPFSVWLNFVNRIGLLVLLQYVSVASLDMALREAHQDLLLRKKAEDELRGTEAFRKRVFDSSHVPIVVMEPESYTFIECNQAAVEFYGLASRAETLGKTPFDVSPTTQEDGSFSAVQGAKYIALALSAGIAVFEWRHQRPDGALMDAEVHLMSFTADGHTYLQFTLIDIRERKQVELALRSSESKYRELWDATVEGIVIHDQGRVVEVNDAMCRMFGVAREQVIGRSLLDFTTLEARDHLFDHIMSGSAGTFETPAMRADGTRLMLEIFAKQINFYNRTLRMVAVRDVTEQRGLEAQFRRTQRLESLGTLAGGIAHDLNNVLTPIMMSLSLLNQKVTDPTLKKHIASLESSAHRGSDIVGQVLLFARGSEKEFAPQQLAHIIGEITAIIQQTFPRNIEIVTDIRGSLCPIRGDATQLHQVLMNLCVNARDAMPQGGRLTISAADHCLSAADATLHFGGPPGEYVVLKIVDTGTGMPKEIQERIFEPFFTTKDIGKGTGLGLSTVYAIVKDHKAYIALASEAGEGTSFTIYFPAIQSQDGVEEGLLKNICGPVPERATCQVYDIS
jgi:PAS domain S-box-containing protein